MKNIEQIFREILYQAIEKSNHRLTQLELSKNLNFSLSTVNLAIKKLEKINSVKIEKMGFRVIDVKKIIYYWASIRNLEKDIIYKTRAEMPAVEIEKSMPPKITYGAYSAYKFKYKDIPADYSEIYIYADEKELDEIKKRFPKNEKIPNLFILKKDKLIEKYSNTGTTAQIFVDLWNVKEWYAKEFIKNLENKIGD